MPRYLHIPHTPTRSLPPSRGGLTVGCFSASTFSEKPHTSHR